MSRAHDRVTLLDWPRPYTRSSYNQRTSPRVTAPFTVRVQDRARREWQGINLSQGGMLCRAQPPWWPGNEVHLALQLPQQTVEVIGQVVELLDHQGEIAMRVCFDPMQKARRAIARWLQKPGS